MHPCQIEIWRQRFAGKRRHSFISSPGKEATQKASGSRSMPAQEELVRNFIVRACSLEKEIRLKAVTGLHSSFFRKISKQSQPELASGIIGVGPLCSDLSMTFLLK